MQGLRKLQAQAPVEPAGARALLELKRVAPDALVPIVDETEAEGQFDGLWKRQRQTRRNLYRIVRISIAEDGFDGLSLRRVARRCDLSPQTVYNLVGNRETMIAASVCDHQNAMIAAAKTLLVHYPAFALAYADVLWSCAARNSKYIRNLTTAHHRSPASVERTIRNEVISGVLNALKDPDCVSVLRPAVDPKWLARSVFNIAAASARYWAEDFTDADDLRKDLVTGLAMLMLGALRPSAAAPIEEWLGSLPLRIS